MNYPSIRIEGAILSPDILERIEDAPGQRPSDFGLTGAARVKEEIARAWAGAQDVRVPNTVVKLLGIPGKRGFQCHCRLGAAHRVQTGIRAGRLLLSLLSSAPAMTQAMEQVSGSSHVESHYLLVNSIKYNN
jgi:hypothetical protein